MPGRLADKIGLFLSSGSPAMGVVQVVFFRIRAFLVPPLSLAAENVALRQQIAVLKHQPRRQWR